MQKTFSDEVKQAVYEAQNGYCKICTEKIHSIHHILHNTAPNRRRFPLFIHSPFNACPLCEACHRGQNKEKFKISLKEADMYEEYLTNLKGES